MREQEHRRQLFNLDRGHNEPAESMVLRLSRPIFDTGHGSEIASDVVGAALCKHHVYMSPVTNYLHHAARACKS